MATEGSQRPLTEPHPVALDVDEPWSDEILAAHRLALEANEPGYADPATGLFVFTAVWLRKVGKCCGKGCRHCPYLD